MNRLAELMPNAPDNFAEAVGTLAKLVQVGDAILSVNQRVAITEKRST